jgi:hypothetical protein
VHPEKVILLAKFIFSWRSSDLALDICTISTGTTLRRTDFLKKVNRSERKGLSCMTINTRFSEL